MLQSNEVAREIEQRKSYAEQCFTVLGVSDVVYGDLPCGRFDTEPLIDIGKRIEVQIAEFQPDTVITHCGHDANSDHRLTFNAVIAATRPIPGTSIRNVLSFETPSSTEWRFVEVFRPSLFVDVTDYIDTKIKAFDCYLPTEGKPFPFPRSEEGLMTLARYRGMQAGVQCAEAFEVIRSVLMNDARTPCER
jgi:LmbE family N-acetylglucosaminyl deacetylase